MKEFSIWDDKRFKSFSIGDRFMAGPFEISTLRVTHSIPDSCGVAFTCADGTIVHTGDWKIDETPIDGQHFDRESFDLLGGPTRPALWDACGLDCVGCRV